MAELNGNQIKVNITIASTSMEVLFKGENVKVSHTHVESYFDTLEEVYDFLQNNKSIILTYHISGLQDTI